MDINTPVPTIFGELRQKYGETWSRQIEALRAKFGPAIEEVRLPGDYPTDLPIVYVKKESIVAVLAFAKAEPGFEYKFLSDITATDEESDPRFEVVYQLYAMGQGARLRFKVRVGETEEVPTATSLWPAANWAEREVYDMFGIKFTGHPDLRRILMDERWVGHPLRKDYPLKGYQIFPEPMQAHPELLD